MKHEEYSEIMKILLEIKGDIGGINEHLKNLNGTVAKHEESMKAHEEDIAKLKAFVYKCMGGFTVGMILLQGILVR